MKGALRMLAQLGIFLLIVASFLSPCLLAEQYFELSKPWPMLIGVGSMSLLLVGIVLWFRSVQQAGEKALQLLHHPLFGKISVLKDRWKARVLLPGMNGETEICGELGKAIPSKDQVESFAALCSPNSKFLADARKACIEMARPIGVELTEPDLTLESIWISADSTGQFDLSFDTPRVVEKIPWGLTVRFTEFKVEMAEFDH